MRPALPLIGRVLARALQQVALQQHERKRDADDEDGDRRHQMVRRRPELVGELVQICREDEMAFGITQDERKAEELDAEEENQHRGKKQRRHDERQAHRERHAQRRGARRCARLLDIGAEVLQRGRRVDVDVGHVREPGDDRHRRHRVEAPRRLLDAEQFLHPHTV
jgi:hypothetical protein